MPRSTRHLRVRRLKADIIPLFDLLESENSSPEIKPDPSLFYNFLLSRFEWFQLDIIKQFDELESLTNPIHLRVPFPSDISAYISILPETALNRLLHFQLEITHEFDLDSNIFNVIPLLPCGLLGSQPSQYFKSRMPTRAPNKNFRRRTFPFPTSNRDLQLRSIILPICVSFILIFSVAKSASPLASKEPHFNMDGLLQIPWDQSYHRFHLPTYRWIILYKHQRLSYRHAGPDSITYASFHWNITSQRRNPRPFPRAGVG